MEERQQLCDVRPAANGAHQAEAIAWAQEAAGHTIAPSGGADRPVPPPTDEAPEAPGLVRAFSAPFQDTSRRFWEKAAAFWAISLVGVAAAATVTRLGWQGIGPVLSCAIACGLTAGAAASGAGPENTPRSGRVLVVLLPATLTALILGGVLLGCAHQLLFLPSAGRLTAVSAICYFATYCAASFMAPIGALFRPRRWPAAARRMITNWHRVAGVAILALAYLLIALPAVVIVAAAPEFFRAKFVRLLKKPSWALLAPLAGMSEVASGIARETRLSTSVGLGRTVSLAARRCRSFLAAVPAMIIGSWYAIFVTTAHILAQLGSVRLEAVTRG